MVTRGAYYDDDEEASFRRYSNRHAYPLSHDRNLPPTPHHAPYARSQHISSHSRNNRQSPEQDSNAQPRRRIPVACGRCRKRKIRCSGDPGNGQPCSNCKSAGNESCQFLRVSSTEAQMKSEGTDFVFDTAAASNRAGVHCRTSVTGYGPQHQPYTSHVTLLAQDGYPYRQNSLSMYPATAKAYYGISNYGDFPDENVDYGMHASSYPIMNQESINNPYVSAGPSRVWTPGPQMPKNNSLFVDQEPSYNHGQLPYHSFPIRPTISPEPKSLPPNGLPTALPPPINGTDRVLPFPASNRQTQPAGSYVRSTESFLPMTQAPLQFSNDSLMSTSILNNLNKAQAQALQVNVSAVSENSPITSSYLPLSSSPSDSAPSSQMSFGTQSGSSSHQQSDGYIPNQNSLYHHQNASGELHYGPSTGSSSNRGSVSSQTNADESGVGSLINGYNYHPPAATQGPYPAPPMITMQPTTTEIKRQHSVVT